MISDETGMRARGDEGGLTYYQLMELPFATLSHMYVE